jgi:hypothetical protein
VTHKLFRVHSSNRQIATMSLTPALAEVLLNDADRLLIANPYGWNEYKFFDEVKNKLIQLGYPAPTFEEVV